MEPADVHGARNNVMIVAHAAAAHAAAHAAAQNAAAVTHQIAPNMAGRVQAAGVAVGQKRPPPDDDRVGVSTGAQNRKQIHNDINRRRTARINTLIDALADRVPGPGRAPPQPQQCQADPQQSPSVGMEQPPRAGLQQSRPPRVVTEESQSLRTGVEQLAAAAMLQQPLREGAEPSQSATEAVEQSATVGVERSPKVEAPSSEVPREDANDDDKSSRTESDKGELHDDGELASPMPPPRQAMAASEAAGIQQKSAPVWATLEPQRPAMPVAPRGPPVKDERSKAAILQGVSRLHPPTLTHPSRPHCAPAVACLSHGRAHLGGRCVVLPRRSAELLSRQQHRPARGDVRQPRYEQFWAGQPADPPRIWLSADANWLSADGPAVNHGGEACDLEGKANAEARLVAAATAWCTGCGSLQSKCGS